MLWAWSLLEEVAPVVLFFVVSEVHDFLTGVAAMVVATLVILGVSVAAGRRVPRFAVVSTAGVALFGAASLYFGESDYFILSDTILDGLFALLLLGSLVVGRTPLLKPLFASAFAITDEAWRILTLRWGLLFLVLAIANEYIRLTQTDETWALFKLVSTFGILLFGCYQFTLSARLRLPGESNWLGLRVRSRR